MARRLLHSYLVLITITVLLLALIAYRTTQQTFTSYREAHASAHTEMLPSMLSYYYTTNGSWEGIQLDVSRISLMVGTRISLVDANGLIVAATQRTLVGQMVDEGFEADEVLTILGESGGAIGTVYVQFSQTLRQADQRFLANFLWGFIVAGALAAILTIGVGFFLARSMTRPLAEMNAAASEISQGNYGVRVSAQGQDEVAALGNTFNRMAEGLGSVEHLRRELVANVSHDLRTPLTVIRGYLEGLRSGKIADRRSAEQVFEIMDSEVAHLLHLVEDLHQVAELDTDRLSLKYTEISIDELVQGAMKRVFSLTEEKEILLTSAIPPMLPLIQVDSNRMGQVLFNLLQNAIYHTPSQGSITISAQATSTEISLSVQDTGEGIPPEDQPHIFERFYRVDSARNRSKGGAGLGLSIVKSTVEAHGGRVELKSSEVPNQGSQFILHLPLHPIQNKSEDD